MPSFLKQPSLAITLLACSTIAAANDRPLQPVGLEVTTHLGDSQHFVQGDEIAFLLTLDKDAYITAIYTDASGKRYQILPNAEQHEHYYKASLFISLPAAQSGFRFRVDAPYGKESLRVFASDKEIPALPGETLASGIKRLSWKLDKIRRFIKQHSDRYFDEAVVEVHTSATSH